MKELAIGLPAKSPGPPHGSRLRATTASPGHNPASPASLKALPFKFLRVEAFPSLSGRPAPVQPVDQLASFTFPDSRFFR